MKDRAGNSMCGQDFMAGTICSDRPGHEGPHSCACQACGGDWMNETCTCGSEESTVGWLEQRFSGAKWSLVDYRDTCEQGSGETFTVDVQGYGVVTVENWSSGSGGGVDIYLGGREVWREVSDFLGEEDLTYLVEEWIYYVSAAFWDEMRRLGHEDNMAKALVAARKVQPAPQ